jgi:hypothetical protein
MSEEFPGDPSELVLRRIAGQEKQRLEDLSILVRELKENLHAAAEAHAEKEIKSFNRIAELEAALREIRDYLIPPTGSGMDLYYNGIRHAAEMARKALKEGE